MQFSVYSQIMITPLNKPNSLSVCGPDSTFSLIIANTSGQTVNGSILTLDLPESCKYIPGTIVNATEQDISNPNQPVFIVSDIINNSSLQIDYNAEIVCDYDNTQPFNYILNYNNQNYTGFDTPLQNFYYATVVITNITNSSVTIPVTQTVTREFTIEQQGINASVDTLFLIDEHSTDIEVISVSIGSLIHDPGPGPVLYDTIIITGADLPGGNGSFDYGETILISETIKLVGCNNGQSTINATWGCYNELCESFYAFPSVNPESGVPSIDMEVTGNNRGWGFIENSGYIEFTISNNGTGAGTAFNFTTLGGFSSSSGTYFPNNNWHNEVDSFSVNGNYLPAQYNYGSSAVLGRYAHYFRYQYNFDPDGPGTGLEDIDGDGFYDDLPVGHTITVKAHTYYNWNEAQATIPTNNACGNGWTDNRWQGFRFGYDIDDQCSSSTGPTWVPPNTNVLLFMTYNTITEEHTIPADIYEGETVWMEQEVATSTRVDDEGCPNDSVIYQLEIPDGIVVGPGVATYRGASMGSPMISGNTVTYFLDKDDIKYGGVFRVPFRINCNVSHPPTATISTSLKFWCDRSLYPARYFTYWCSESPVFGIQCPPGNCSDPYISDFKVERTTMGWRDNQLTQKVGPGITGLRLDNAMALDSIRISSTCLIGDNADSLYLIISHENLPGNWSNNLFFDYLTDTLRYYDSETNSWEICSNLSPAISDGSSSSVLLEIGVLTKAGNCLENISITSGDSLIYELYGRVKNVSQTNWNTVPALRAHYYNLSNNSEIYCNDRGATFNILGSNHVNSTNTYINPTIVEGCDDLLFYGQIYRWLDICGGDHAFPNEVRPYVVLDSIIFNLPEGIDYQPGTSSHRYRDTINVFHNEPVSDPVIQYLPGITRLIYVRDASWSYSAYYDCSRNEDRIQFYANAACQSDQQITYDIETKGRYQFYTDGTGISHNGNNSASKPYSNAEILLTPLIETAEGRYDTVQWQIRLCNTTTIDANNNWIAFESSGAGIEVTEIIDVSDINNPQSIPVASYAPGSYWGQLGEIAGNQCAIYDIKAVYSSCTTDSLLVRQAFNCNGYPVNPDLGHQPTGYQCNENYSYLYLVPNDVSLSLAVSSPVNPIDLCDTLQYEATVSNTMLSYAYNLQLSLILPPGVMVVSGETVFSYPSNSGTYLPLSDPVNIPVGSNNWVYDISGDPNGVEILKGVDSIPNNGYSLKFKTITDCDLISGTSILVTASASNACGAVKNRISYTSPIQVQGIPEDVNLYVLSTESNNSLNTCSQPETIKTKIINLGPNSASNIELLSVSCDDAFDYVPGSLVSIHNGPSGVATNQVIGGVRYLRFDIQPGLGINDSIVFTYDLIDVDPGSMTCDTIPVVTSAMLVASVPCSAAPGGSCDIMSITATLTDYFSVEKDNVQFGSLSVYSNPSSGSSELVFVDYSIVNSGHNILNSDSLEVVFMYDSNGNGLPDETGSDSLYAQKVEVNNLAPLDSITSNVSFSAQTEKLCNLLVAIRLSEDTCICSTVIYPVGVVQLENTINDTLVCEQQTINIGMDSVQGQTYTWVPSVYLSSNNISNPEFTYTGSLTIIDTIDYKLITTRPTGCSTTDSLRILIFPEAYSNAGSDQVICESHSFDFATSITQPFAVNYDSIRWSGGLGSFNDSSLLHPVYTPAIGELGDLELFLTAYGINNCNQSVSSMTLTIDTMPDPEIVLVPDNNICVEEEIQFNGFNNNSTNVIAWQWLFGDGGTSSAQVGYHSYTASGAYEVWLIALNSSGCADSVSAIINVNENPVASFTTSPEDTTCPGAGVEFNSTSTTNIINWYWDLGDGNLDTGQVINHIYQNNGDYSIHLFVENDLTCRDTVMDSIHVREAPVASIITTPVDTSCLNDTVFFNASGSPNIVSWQWNFGDGNTATGPNVNNIYQSTGTFYYYLAITDLLGCSDTIRDSMQIRQPQPADFIISSSDTSCVNEDVTFMGISPYNIAQWYWDFGDGSNDMGHIVTHQYAVPGAYKVMLIYTDENGCMDTVTHQKIISDPNIDLSAFPSPACFGDSSFFASSGENITYSSYIWDFGDGTQTDTGYSAAHLYTFSDTFNVSLSVCSKTALLEYVVNPVCEVFAGGNQATCQDVYFNYGNSATPPTAEGYASIQWTTTGLGYFSDNTLIAPTYFPHPDEGAIQNDTITMMMVGYGLPPCSNDTSYMELIVIPGAYAQAGSDENACINEPYDFSNSQDSAFATNYAAIKWLTTGTGHFIDSTVMRPVYIPGPDELGPITMTMIATNIINCDSIDEMILTYHPVYEVPITTTICHYDSAFLEGEWRYETGVFYDTLQSAPGCDSVIVTGLIVRPKIDKSFVTSSGDSICRNELVSFDPVGSATIIDQYWDFGDGNFSYSPAPQYAYDTTGSFTVIYYYTDINGCSDSSVRDITVFELPDVSFEINMGNACVGFPVEFTGSSSFDIADWHWDFGDGQTGSGQVVEHIYSDFGEMLIILTVTDVAGCSQSVSQSLVVLQQSNAEFTWDFFSCDSVKFTDQSTSPEGYNIVQWHWDFGDGDTSDLQNPVHVFPENTTPGGEYYTVTLVITSDSLGYLCNSTVNHLIWVNPIPDIFFNWSPEPTCLGNITNFYGGSGFPVQTWHWNMGDGHFYINQNPTHIYADTGTYEVIFTVIDTNYCQNSTTNLVSVVPVPEVSFTMSDTVSCSSSSVSFIGTTSANVTSWYWEFGDGGVSTLANPTHFYSQSGSFTITLTVTDNQGCSSEFTDNILILAEPEAQFSHQNLTCATVAFTDLSSAPSGYNIVSWYWEFGDGTFSTVQNPVHQYSDGAGVYDVKLIVASDSAGYSCQDSVIQTVLTPGLPSVFFVWNPEPTMLGEITYFFGSSGDQITDWYWDMGDGNFATGQNPEHIYASAGVYNVKLIITDIDGCQNYVIHQVTVDNPPEIDFSWNHPCEGDPVQFNILDPPTNIADVVSWYWTFGDGGQSTQMEPLHVYAAAGTYNVSLTITTNTGAFNTLTKEIVIIPPPVALFGADPPYCQNYQVQFMDYSTSQSGQIVKWTWDMGDGNQYVIDFPDNPDIIHNYTQSGNYLMLLSILTSDSCTAEYSETITISSAPAADFTFNTTCAGNPVEFFNNSLPNGGGEIISYYWDFGDPSSGNENTSALENPVHVYSAAGDYDVTLVVSNINECVDTVVIPVSVSEEPEVAFTYSTACLGQETEFESSTTSNVLSYGWNFGDGGTSTEANPNYTYLQAGNYLVTLTIITDDSCSASTASYVNVNGLPLANFDYSSPACIGQEIEFISLSQSPNGQIETWEWDFDDGNTTTITSPDNPNTLHTYTSGGNYSVSLLVTDFEGCENTVIRDVEVVDNPLADFTFEENCFADPVVFTDISSENGGTPIQSWTWYFGDPGSGTNNTSSLQNPTHIFSAPGTYNTTLIVENVTGCSDTIVQEIEIDPLPELEIEVANDSICLGELAEFTGVGTDIATWFWEFGDGGSSVEQNPSYGYSQPGVYLVVLTGTGSDGCISVSNTEVIVNGKPNAAFTNTSSCTGDSTYFTDLSTSQFGLIVQWLWDFGDGNSSTLQNPVHYYQNPQDHSVTLIVTDNSGCSDTLTKIISVESTPVPGFTWVQVCEPIGQVHFFDESTPAASNSPITQWLWEFGDGNYSSTIDPSYVYQFLDSCYTVTLTVTDDNGCSSTDSISDICLSAPPQVSFIADTVCYKQATSLHALTHPGADSIVRYLWNFNDGSQEIETEYDTISHIFIHPGLNIVKLTVMGLDSCESEINLGVWVDSLPVPQFDNTLESCGNPVMFTDLSLNGGSPILHWNWTFDDTISGLNNYSSEQDPFHSFGMYDSTYYVQLIVTNENGCIDTTLQEVFVKPCLIAAFEFDPYTCSRAQDTIIDTSKIYSHNGVIESWHWDFGDYTTYDYNDFIDTNYHTWHELGTYDVSLTISTTINGIDYSDSYVTQKNVVQGPSANFGFESICFGDTVQFNDLTATGGVPLTTWRWDFGDSTFVSDTLVQNPIYMYPEPGTYTVRLKVTNENYCCSKKFKDITIHEKPEADFIWQDTCQGYYTYFTNKSGSGLNEIKQYRWNFGDSLSEIDYSDEINPVYIYDSSGTYKVQLNIIDENLCVDSIDQIVEIYPVPTSDFIILDTLQQGQIYLQNLSEDATDYFWDFNYDYGYFSTETNPIHQYEVDGNYTIMLISSNEYGCPDSSYQFHEIKFKNLFVPNAFSPSSDIEELQVFKPVGINIKQYKMTIISPKGGVVFETTRLTDGKPAEGWDGTYLGTELPNGSYVWSIYAVFEDGTLWKGTDNGDGNTNTSGTVTMIR